MTLIPDEDDDEGSYSLTKRHWTVYDWNGRIGCWGFVPAATCCLLLRSEMAMIWEYEPESTFGMLVEGKKGGPKSVARSLGETNKV